MGDTAKMVAVAEVYETDIGAVEKGQRARITSPALDGPLLGVVASIGLKIGRMDVLDSDPIAKTDARVVEVRIALDSSETVAALTNLLVEGGGQVLAQFLDQNFADQAHIFVAPILIGDQNAIRPTRLPSPAKVSQALHPTECLISLVGPDVLFQLCISQANPPDKPNSPA